MDYKEVSCTISPCSDTNKDILIAFLSEAGFDGFEEHNEGISAYIKMSAFSESMLNSVCERCNGIFELKIQCSDINRQNWNKLWEENFPPVIVDSRCIIRAPFHDITTKTEYELIIEPKMAFGTGHHSTTRMMIEELLETDTTHKNVLDMGCGTGVLAILALKKGAAKVVAIDFDEWACENTLENAQKNGMHEIQVINGGFETIGNEKFDFVMANINTNALTEGMSFLANSITGNGKLTLSGFYDSDLAHIVESAENNGLKFLFQKELNNWVAASFTTQTDLFKKNI